MHVILVIKIAIFKTEHVNPAISWHFVMNAQSLHNVLNVKMILISLTAVLSVNYAVNQWSIAWNVVLQVFALNASITPML